MGLALVLDVCYCCDTPSICPVFPESPLDLQLTLSGLSQINTPAIFTVPCQTCDSFNGTYSLPYTSRDVFTVVCIGGSIPEDVLTTPCYYQPIPAEDFSCGDVIDGFERAVTLVVDVFIYQNITGGVSCFVRVSVSEFDEADILSNTAIYEGHVVVDADNDTLTAPISFELDVELVCSQEEVVVWCGGPTLHVVIESV